MWWALAMLVVSVIINAALQPKPAEPKAATFEDFDLPVVEEGSSQIVYFGECWTGDWQVLGYGNFRTKKVRASQAKK